MSRSSKTALRKARSPVLGHRALSGDARKAGSDDFWRIVQFSSADYFAQLSNEDCMRDSAEQGISYLYNFLKHMRCSTMVVENEYVDRDFLDDFSNYYVKCFKQYPKLCKRIHFFSKLNESDLSDYLDGSVDAAEITKTLNSAYLGYIIARPLPKAIIGRSVLRPWDGSVFEGEDNAGKRSIRCVNTYHPNLAGLELSVDGLAFQEQDTVLSTCATSALWSAFQRTSRLFGHALPTLFEITSHATRYYQKTRSIPSEGLTPAQMCQAIRETGLEAEIRDVYAPVVRKEEDSEDGGEDVGAEEKDADGGTRGVFETEFTEDYRYNFPLLSGSYGYLRAGIPVVLAVEVKGEGGHAITLVGYRIGERNPDVDEMKLWQPESSMKFKGSRITHLYAHDDQIGPYSRLSVQPGKEIAGIPAYPIELGSDWRTESGSPLALVPLSMIFPLYHKIRVPIVAPFRIANRMEMLLERPMGGAQIEWDIFLTSVNDYKKEISTKKDIPAKVRREILLRRSPRFFWRTRAFVGHTEICELLVDATDMEMSFQLFGLNLFDPALPEELRDVPSDVRHILEDDAFNIGRLLLRFIGNGVPDDA